VIGTVMSASVQYIPKAASWQVESFSANYLTAVLYRTVPYHTVPYCMTGSSWHYLPGWQMTLGMQHACSLL
jgi:hypothetical protein